MNPFIGHSILKDLPYELMKSPKKEKILRFVEKKRKLRSWLAYFVILFGVILTVANMFIYQNNLANNLNLFNSGMWLVGGIWLFYQSKRIAIPSEELDELLLQYEKRIISA